HVAVGAGVPDLLQASRGTSGIRDRPRAVLERQDRQHVSLARAGEDEPEIQRGYHPLRAAERPHSMKPATAKATLRVLLVEDSPRIAERMRDIVESEASAKVVHIADDETGAIVAVREHEADVLILDLQLRRGNGFN